MLPWSSHQNTAEHPRNPKDHDAKLDLPCLHPANVLFKDPRSPPPPLPSQASILSRLLREHAPNTEYFRTVIDAYFRDGEEDESGKSVPRRTLHVRAIDQPWVGTYGVVIPQLPVPHIARVCYEARDAVLRKGRKFGLYRKTKPDSVIEIPYQPLETSAIEFASHEDTPYEPAGFLMPSDRLYYHGPDRDPNNPNLNGGHCGLNGVRLTTGRELPHALESSEVAVWLYDISDFRDPAPFDLNSEFDVRKDEMFLRGLSNMDTIFMLLRCHVTDITFPDKKQRAALYKEFWPANPNNDRERAPREFHPPFGIANIFVDLYDDQTLAEITSLHTPRNNDSTPRPLAQCCSSIRCFNCERTIWEDWMSQLVQRFWLLLHADELDEFELAIAVPTVFRGAIPYNPNHPWVKEKLSQAPKFRPAVIFNLTPARPAK